MEPGDHAYFTDMDGNVFAYEVVLVETLHQTDVEELESSGWALSMFTRAKDGYYRTTVRCQRVDN